jgi:hypothetical protein
VPANTVLEDDGFSAHNGDRKLCLLLEDTMTRVGRVARWSLALAIALPGGALAQTADVLGTVRLSSKVTANGQPLEPGTYTLRLSSEPVRSVSGQAPDSAKWVEFVQSGQVKGRELATVVAAPDAKTVAKRTPPAEGRPMVHTLRGAEYVRVWVNRGGTQYLIHLVR